MRVSAVLFVLSVLLVGAFYDTPKTFAKVTVSDPVLQVSPASPKPFEQVTVSIANPNVVPTGSTVQWFVDDVEYTDNQNSRNISFFAKGIGESTTVEARVTEPNETKRSLTATIEPIRIDLVVTANGHTPSFYGGRVLPTRSSQISVAAFVFDDTAGPYTYTWRVNGRLQQSVLGKTNNLVTFKPGLDYEMYVEVEVADQSGNLVAADTANIPLFEPQLIFYEASPLRGLVPNALKNSYFFMNDEITLRGEPYYFSGSTLDSYDIRWEIDNKKIAGDEYPLELSLVKNFDTGRANVDLRVINTDDYMESADASLVIEY